MTQRRSKSNNSTWKPERHARPGSDYGLVRRVAISLGKNESLVSGVKRGTVPVRGPETQRIAEALGKERESMRREEIRRVKQAGR